MRLLGFYALWSFFLFLSWCVDLHTHCWCFTGWPLFSIAMSNTHSIAQRLNQGQRSVMLVKIVCWSLRVHMKPTLYFLHCRTVGYRCGCCARGHLSEDLHWNWHPKSRQKWYVTLPSFNVIRSLWKYATANTALRSTWCCASWHFTGVLNLKHCHSSLCVCL